MTFFLYDSLSKVKKEFIPINSKNIRVYACGPTVYSYAHIGNARMSVVTDLLINVLRSKFANVKFVSNITDVDDKIIEVAKSEKKSIHDITSKYHKIYNQDMEMLGVKPPDIQPKATDHINEMILMIEKLIKNKCAYLSDKNVLFDVSKYKYYGTLSRRSKTEQIAGSRIEVAKYKKNPEDFILWKPSEKNSEPGWESPWGFGRPGWHIECSAMSEKCLGIPFDIHCGGVDLTFPHHENEIAQSCSAHKINTEPQNFSKYWFHNGFVTVNGEKMSKSIGNITLVNDLLKKFSGSTIRLSLLSSHYRQPLDWSEKILEQSHKNIKKFKRILNKFSHSTLEYSENDPYFNEFLNDLYDDLNTPKALATINRFLDQCKDGYKETNLVPSINKCFEVLGINLDEFCDNEVELNEDEKKTITALIKERNKARENKDFEKADKIRETLKEMSIEIEDSSNGTNWKKID